MPFIAKSLRGRRLAYRQMLANHQVALVLITFLGFFALYGMRKEVNTTSVLLVLCTLAAYVPLFARKDEKRRAVLTVAVAGLFSLAVLVALCTGIPHLLESIRLMRHFFYPQALLIAVVFVGVPLTLLILPWYFTLQRGVKYLRSRAAEWQPISREELDGLVRHSMKRMYRDEKKLWQEIRMEPEKWREPVFAPQDAFWAVATHEGRVIWYNDIEEGFNVSPFTERGAIEEYGTEQLDLCDAVKKLLEKEDPPRKQSPTEIRGSLS